MNKLTEDIFQWGEEKGCSLFNNQSITTSAFSSHRHWVSRFVVQEREASLALPSLFQVLF